MTPVFQTIYDSKIGNCLQASVASLLEVPLNEVPHVMEKENGCIADLVPFFKSKGYTVKEQLFSKGYTRLKNPTWGCLSSENWDVPWLLTKKKLKKRNGLNGFFLGTVYSPTYFSFQNMVAHAVVIDKDFNIVHDPCSNYVKVNHYPLHDLLGFNGVIEVIVIEKE